MDDSAIAAWAGAAVEEYKEQLIAAFDKLKHVRRKFERCIAPDCLSCAQPEVSAAFLLSMKSTTLAASV